MHVLLELHPQFLQGWSLPLKVFSSLVVHHTVAWTQEMCETKGDSVHHDMKSASLKSLCVHPTLNSSVLGTGEYNTSIFSRKICSCPFWWYEHFPVLSGNSYHGITAIFFIATSLESLWLPVIVYWPAFSSFPEFLIFFPDLFQLQFPAFSRNCYP